jgi:CheY-like chemotaxis protein
VLVDFAMPGMNGAELARQIRRKRPDQPIAFVTGYAESEQLDAAVGHDAIVLRKPFSMGELSAVIGRTLAAKASENG